jgi:hypothetical protein
MQMIRVVIALCVLVGSLAARTWTDSQGRSFDGEMLSAEGDYVTIRRSANNKTYRVKISSLSRTDQKFVQEENRQDGDLTDTSWVAKWDGGQPFVIRFLENENGVLTVEEAYIEDGNVISGKHVVSEVESHYEGTYLKFCGVSFKLVSSSEAIAVSTKNYKYRATKFVRLDEWQPDPRRVNLSEAGWSPVTDDPINVARLIRGSNAMSRRATVEKKWVDLIRNGGFEEGRKGWSNTVSIVDDPWLDGNEVAMLDARERKNNFGQEVKTRGLKKLVVIFETAGSKNYKGDGYRVRFTRDDDSYVFYDFTLNSKSWSNGQVVFDQLDGSKEVLIEVEPKSLRSGALFFDNFSVSSN